MNRILAWLGLGWEGALILQAEAAFRGGLLERGHQANCLLTIQKNRYTQDIRGYIVEIDGRRHEIAREYASKIWIDVKLRECQLAMERCR